VSFLGRIFVGEKHCERATILKMYHNIYLMIYLMLLLYNILINKSVAFLHLPCIVHAF
jgi:hypothetical protein